MPEVKVKDLGKAGNMPILLGEGRSVLALLTLLMMVKLLSSVGFTLHLSRQDTLETCFPANE